MSSQVAQRGRDRAGVRGVRTMMALLLAALAMATVGSVLTASPASAHATVSRAEPADQSHLMAPPGAVTVEFSEAVNPSVGDRAGLTVMNAAGTEVQTAVDQPEPSTLRATLPSGLPDGTYVATYRIISEDGHPISGSLVFAVGHADLADVSGLTVTTDTTMDTFSKVGQFLMYLGALAVAGLVFFLAALYEPCPSAVRDRERRTMARLTWIGAALTVLGMAIVLVAQTAQATGEGAGAVLDPGNLGGVLSEGLGAQNAGILAGLVLCLVSLSLARGTAAKIVAATGGLLATASFVLWGHAVEGANTWLTVPADAIHLVVAAVWFGGLVGLFVVLRSRSAGSMPPAAAADGPAAAPAVHREAGGDPAGAGAEPALAGSPTVTAVLDDPDPVDGGASVLVRGAGDPSPAGGDSDLPATVLCVRRFSAAAFVSLLVLSAAGVAVGLVEMGGLGTLFSTTYGRLLLAKLGVVAVVAAAAGYNRFYLLPWLLADSAEGPAVDADRQRSGWRTLLSTVRFEALAIVVVLVLTAVLVNTTPGASAAKAAPTGPFHQSQPIDGGEVSLAVTPNRPGVNSIMVNVTGPGGQPREVLDVQVEMTLESAGVGPIARKLPAHGAGHYMLADTRDLSIAGDWTIDVVVRLDEFDETRLTFQDSVS